MEASAREVIKMNSLMSESAGVADAKTREVDDLKNQVQAAKGDTEALRLESQKKEAAINKAPCVPLRSPTPPCIPSN